MAAGLRRVARVGTLDRVGTRVRAGIPDQALILVQVLTQAVLIIAMIIRKEQQNGNR